MINKKPKRVSYEEAMNEAFQVIFENLKEIEKEKQKKLRQKQDFEKRRGGAPSVVLSEETSQFLEHMTKREVCLPLYQPGQVRGKSRELSCLRKQRPPPVLSLP